jgi:DNA-binding FadR family transcriptional regulator
VITDSPGAPGRPRRAVPAAPRRAVGERGLHGRVLVTLGEHIVDGVIPVGGIINPDEWSTTFGVSRSVTREALRVLQSLGMVEPRQGVGTQVLPRASWNLLHPYVIEWRGRGSEYFQQMHELLQLRLGLEPVAAALAARNMTTEDAATVAVAADRMLAAAESGDGQEFLDADVLFHTAILRGSGNDVFAHAAGTVEALLRTRVEEPRFTITEYSPSSAERHHGLAAAIAARDPEAARRWAFELIDQTVTEFESEDPRRRE